MKNKLIISDFDTSYFTYDPVTGLITNHKTGKVYTEANVKTGYIRIGLRHRITNKSVMVWAHRIAWLLHYGTEPNIVDHQDGDRTNNRITNLVSTSQQGNSQNRKRYKNSTLLVGLYKSGNNFVAQTTSRTNKYISLGTYHTEEHAHLVVTYYKERHITGYRGRDLPDTLNGKTHPYFDGTLIDEVLKINDTSGTAAMLHILSK